MRLARFEDVAIVAQCQNGREALNAIAEQQPDLVFLDIQMPGLSGFDVVRALPTDHAFYIHAIDYVLKPADEQRLEKTIERVRAHQAQQTALADKQRLMHFISDITGEQYQTVDQVLARAEAGQQYPSRISVKDRQETTLVDVRDISWVDAAGDYMCLHVGEQVHIMRCTMKELESLLDPNLFQRIHRSTIINLDQVEKIINHTNGEYFLAMKNGARLKMSRGYKDKIKHFA